VAVFALPAAFVSLAAFASPAAAAAPSFDVASFGAAVAPALLCIGGLACCAARNLVMSALAAVWIRPNNRLIMSGRTPRSCPSAISGVAVAEFGVSLCGFAGTPPPAPPAPPGAGSPGITAVTASSPASATSCPESASCAEEISPAG
jgi:hypothetical protein